jgi:hypothetical protein
MFQHQEIPGQGRPFSEFSDVPRGTVGCQTINRITVSQNNLKLIVRLIGVENQPLPRQRHETHSQFNLLLRLNPFQIHRSVLQQSVLERKLGPNMGNWV